MVCHKDCGSSAVTLSDWCGKHGFSERGTSGGSYKGWGWDDSSARAVRFESGNKADASQNIRTNCETDTKTDQKTDTETNSKTNQKTNEKTSVLKDSNSKACFDRRKGAGYGAASGRR